MKPRSMLALASVMFLAMSAGAPADTQSTPNPRPGQKGHRTHKEWQGEYPTLASQHAFRVVRTLTPPDGFLGNLTFDQASGRLWLISVGPPTNPKGSSTVYEMDPESGKILAQAALPLKGDLSEPAYVDGYLYQPVFHESKIYKIAAGDRARLGQIVKEIPLPTLVDLKLGDEAHAVPFIEFGGVTVTPDKQLLIHADDVGELIKLERETGQIVSRTRTIKAMGGIASVPAAGGKYFVLGNSDPRGGYCALSYPPPLSRTPDQKDISWALIEPASGEVVASIRTQNSRAYASTVELMRQEPVEGKPYGKMTFLATGEEGIVVLEWSPREGAF